MTLGEKLNWIKHHDNFPIKTTLTDKFKAKLWVRKTLDEQIRQHPEQLDCLGDQISGRDYVVPLLGVWNNADEIDFDLLPESFVLKTNHGCGWNIRVQDKGTLDITKTKEKLNYWMSKDWAANNGELQYRNIPHRVIAEEYLAGLTEIQVYCMDGMPRYIGVIEYGTVPCGTCRSFYNAENFELQPFTINDIPYSDNPKPVNLAKLKTIAQWLCSEFKFVRVDLYDVDGRVYFGEMTFSPNAMSIVIKPDEYHTIFGNMLTINDST